MAVALVQAKATESGSSPSVTANLTSAVTAGNLLVVGVYAFGETTANITVTDTLLNTYTKVLTTWQDDGGGSDKLNLYWCVSASGGTNSVKAQVSPSVNGFWGLAVVEFSGVGTPTQSTQSSNSGLNTATFSGSTFTPPAGALLVAFYGDESGAETITTGNGWTQGASSGIGDNNNAISYILSAAGTSTHAQWTMNGSNARQVSGYVVLIPGSGSTAWTRSAAITQTPATTNTRRAAMARSQAVTEAPSTSPTRLLLMARTAATTESTANGTSRLLSLLRAQAVTQTPSTTALRQGLFSRLQTSVSALTTAGTRSGAFLRAQAITEAPAPTASHLLSLLRTQTITAGVTAATSRVMSLRRTGSSTTTPTTTTSRLLAFLRSRAITTSPNTTAARSGTFRRLNAIAVTPATAVGRVMALLRGQAVAAVLTTTGNRLAALSRLGALTEIVSTTASGVINSGSQAWSRAAGITVAVVTSTSRLVGLSRQNQATITPATTAARRGVFSRVATVVTALTAASSRRAALSRLQAITEAVSTTAGGVINGGSQAWTRAAGITVTAITTASRALSFPRLGQTTVTPTTGSTRRVGFGRVTAAVTTPITGILRSVGFQRLSAVTAAIATTSGRVFGLTRQSGVVVASAPHMVRAMVLTRLSPTQIVPVIVASGAQGFGGSVISIVTWAAARVTKTIRDLVTVYVRNQQRANHTLDTAGNFDAAFGTFSGDIVPPPAFPDPRPKTPLDAENLELDQWVTSRLQPGNYSLVTAFSRQQRLALNLRDTFANYDTAYAAFVQAQEPVRWHP